MAVHATPSPPDASLPVKPWNRSSQEMSAAFAQNMSTSQDSIQLRRSASQDIRRSRSSRTKISPDGTRGVGFEGAEDQHLVALRNRLTLAASRLLQRVQNHAHSGSGSLRTSVSGFSPEVAAVVPEHIAKLQEYLLDLGVTTQALESARMRGSSHGGEAWAGDVRTEGTNGEGGEAAGSGNTSASGGFVDSSRFQAVVCCVILLNMLALCLETDHPNWRWWNVLNGLFLLCFVIEILLRAWHRGFVEMLWFGAEWKWMLYDAVAVAIGVVDFAVAVLGPVSGTDGGSLEETDGGRFGEQAAAGGVGIARVLMLSRLLRLYRVVRMNARLYDFVLMLTGMISTFAWILSIILLFCLVLSIVLTRLLGHSDDPGVPEEVRSLFCDIPTSLFSLFQLTTADDWSRIANPLVALNGLWRLFFIAFITFMSWTMLSLLTAVASETMLTASKSKKSEEHVLHEVQRQGFITFICVEFIRADADRSGQLDKEEFLSLMSRPTVKSQMVEHGIDLRDRDISATWDIFDVDQSGQLTIDELVDGFQYLMEDLATKHVAGVGYALKSFTSKMEADAERIEANIAKIAANIGERQALAARRQERFPLTQPPDVVSTITSNTFTAPPPPPLAPVPEPGSPPSPGHRETAVERGKAFLKIITRSGSRSRPGSEEGDF